MAKRFSNVFSRAIEREQEARNNGNGDHAPRDQNDAPSVEMPQARILTMPNRRFSVPQTEDERIEKNAPEIENPPIKSVTPESWKWSEPPQLAANKETRQIGAGDSTALPSLREPATIEVQTETLTITNNGGLAKNGNAANGNGAQQTAAIGAASHRLQSRPAFRAVTIYPEQVEPHLVAITDPRSPHCEEFRNLRTRILHASQTQKLQAITIASGSPSEGKSTVALNLAWLLAQTDGINALIIDSDLRLPCLADYLDVTADCGLSEVFSGEARLEDAILRLEPSGLHLLPGGAARADVAEMLSGNKFRNILEQTRKLFDYIIVDAPSLGIFTDAAVLINQTDAALLVVRAGKTKFGVTNRLLETLPRERMFGVVLNGSDEGLSNDTHYDHYYNVEKKRLSE